MPLAHNADHDEYSPNPDPDWRGDSAPKNKTSSNLRLAANNPESTESKQTRISDFLLKRQAIVIEVIAEFADQRTLSGALMAVTNELHHRFQCDRVAIGLLRKEHMAIAAISQQAVFQARSDEVRLLRDAMQEACDQRITICYPGKANMPETVESHQTLTLDQQNSQICTIPLCHKEKIIGALLLQRRAEHSWSQLTSELLNQIATLTAPLIALRHDAELGVLGTLRARTLDTLEKAIEPRHLVAKATAMLALLLLTFAYFLPVTHHVKAFAEIVPTERRVISAPTNGLISGVFVNPGDTVRTGDILLELDTRELELKLAAQENGILSAHAELRAAMASYDRKEQAIKQAKLDQLNAELALTKRQISKTSIKAPVSGVIVSGDLAQLLGMSVERGQVILEMAPANGNEVHLLINEVDISYVNPAQTGRLSLSANPGDVLDVEVKAIHPIARSAGGANRFLVEAVLEEEFADLRPGQTGIAKLVVGEASLLWVWTHRFLQWSRQRLWEWIG